MKEVIYLAGGFFKDFVGVPWQHCVITRIKDLIKGKNIEIFNPKKFYNPQLKNTEWFDRDLEALSRTTFMFGYINLDNPTGYGLAFEFGYAKSKGAYRILVNEQEQRKWVMTDLSANYFTSDFYDGLEHLERKLKEWFSDE